MEIKARIDDLEECQEKASKLCDGQTPILLYQHDTFFRSPRGRLKLRVFKNQDSVSELIFYDRPDCDGPKLCDFHKASVEDPENLKKTLALSMGILGEVKKKRILFTYEQTRIHLDEVEGLGSFMELEVCLRDDQTLEEGQSVAEEIMQKLGLERSQLVSGAYMDALLSIRA